ncbi:MAG: hypothetical protein GY929_02725, partial [Actinomycetia bacterium]|nr:hypothetical protein [Actinomycetes bacterium]
MGTQQAIELLEAIGRLTIPPQDHPLEYTLATVEKTTEIAGHLLGRRVLVRTRISGVSIGVLDAVEIGASTAVVLSDAVRIWSWSGAYTVSE